MTNDNAPNDLTEDKMKQFATTVALITEEVVMAVNTLVAETIPDDDDLALAMKMMATDLACDMYVSVANKVLTADQLELCSIVKSKMTIKVTETLETIQ